MRNKVNPDITIIPSVYQANVTGMLRNMLPRFSSTNTLDCTIRKLLLLFPYFIRAFSIFPEGSNMNNLFFRNFVPTRILSTSCSSSYLPIPHILFVSSAVKMAWFYTKFCVTFVKDHFPFRYRTIFKHPRKTMRTIAIKIYSVLSVSIYDSSTPDPTIRLIPYWISCYFGPETFNIFRFYDDVLIIS